MTKQEYIQKYNEKLNRIVSDCRKDYKIDNDYVYYYALKGIENYDKAWIKYPIESCIKVCDIYHEAYKYIHSLKVGDNIEIQKFGSNESATILRINMGRKLNRKGELRISTFTVKTEWSEFSIKTTDVCYKGTRFYDILELALMFNPKGYQFFGRYDIKNADELIAKNMLGDFDTKNQKLQILKEQMKKVSAEIGMLEIERNLGKRFVSVKEIDAKKREFASLQAKHKKLYFS